VVSTMMFNRFKKGSIGYGGSDAVKAKSINLNGGKYEKPNHAGDQDAALVSMPKQRRGYQEGDVTTGSGAKGHGGSVKQSATTKDTLQSGGSRYAK
jgi:hypothetical protein